VKGSSDIVVVSDAPTHTHMQRGSTMYPRGGQHGITQQKLFLEDNQFSSREDCNVPTLGHHYIAEVYDVQSSQNGCYSE
jgi:hypothetical protein